MQLNGTKWMLYVGIRAQQSDRILTYKIENVPKLVPIKNSKTLIRNFLSGLLLTYLDSNQERQIQNL